LKLKQVIKSSGCFQLLVLKILETFAVAKQSTDGVAILKITDATFAAAIQKFRKENNHINWYENCLLLVSRCISFWRWLFFALIGLILVYHTWVGENQ
jgi:predicted branched-subunit amino acid permease